MQDRSDLIKNHNKNVLINMIIVNSIICIVCVCALFSDLTTGCKVFVVCFSLLFITTIEHDKDKENNGKNDKS